MRRASACIVAIAGVLTLAVVPGVASAQATPPADTAVRRDSVLGRAPRQPRAGAAPRPGLRPPVTPRRAFLSSLVLPGLGQSRLQRPAAAAVFAGVEMAALVMVRKSLGDLRAAKSVRADSVFTVQPVDSLGQPVAPTARSVGQYPNDLVRARRLHVEDWLAVIIFNHLISGAEAFVSANLYDLPAQISARPTPRGGAVAVSVAW